MKKNTIDNLFKSSLVITCVLMFTKFISFFRDMELANKLGAGMLSDVFLASSSVLMLFTSFVRSPFAASYLPIATDYYIKEDKTTQGEFFGTIYGAAIVAGVIFCVFEFVFITPITELIVPGFSSVAKYSLQQIVCIQLPVLLMSFVLAVNTSNLKLLGKFGVSEISEVFAPCICIVYMVFCSKDVSINILSACVVGGYFIAAISQCAVMYRAGIRPKINFKFKNCKGLTSVIYAMLPFMLAATSREINTIVDKVIGSKLPTGSITILSYASKMTVTEVGLIATAISVVIFSQMARLNAENDVEGLGETISSGIKFVNTLLIPLSIGTIVLSENIIQVLFGHGEFDSANVKVTASVMCIYAIGMMGAGMQDVLMRAMHATKHRKFPASMSIVMVICNVILNILLYKPLGIYGLAIATSIATLVIIVPLYFYLDKRVVKISGKYKLSKNIFLVILSSTVMGVVVIVAEIFLRNLINNEILILLYATLFGIITYSFMMFFTKNEIFYSLVLKKGVK